MSSDLSEFLEVFFEECSEGLVIMESGLIALDSDNVDNEEINTIFRAAHSIKGGAAAFAMTEVADFTHVMETLLDEMRDGRRQVSRPAVDLLLTSLDGLTNMINAIRTEQPIDVAQIERLKAELDAMLATSGSTDDSSGEDLTDVPGPHAASQASEVSSDNADCGAQTMRWEIQFTPNANLFATGNDPQHMFRALAELGELEVTANTDAIIGLEGYVPHSCYLSWQLVLASEASEGQIREVFAWVEDDCGLTISNTPLAEARALVAAQTAVSVAAPAAASTEDNLAQVSTPLAPTVVVASETPATQPSTIQAVHGAAQSKARQSSSEGASIRVNIDKVDELINLVGELVITQSMLGRFSDGIQDDELETLRAGLITLSRNTRELQEAAMQIRMLPISSCFNRFPRLVRDLSAKLGKNIELKITGEGTELDKTVLEKINDPMVHLVRNSLDHGIEMPEERKAAGKPKTGTLTLNASHQGGSILIEVIDDGAGLNTEKLRSKAIERGIIAADADMSDEQINNLIFHAGFSTNDVVSDLSGRGVGMDVVRRNIEDLGGSVSVHSVRGTGSTLAIKLPLTMAILDGQLVQVGDQTYIISLVSIVESLQVTLDKANVIAGTSEVYQFRNEFLPVLRLHEVFNIIPNSTDLDKGLLVVVEANGGRVGVFVDDLLGQQQVVIKSLETNFRQVDCLAGATILGDGTVALILDIPGLVRHSHSRSPIAASRQQAA